MLSYTTKTKIAILKDTIQHINKPRYVIEDGYVFTKQNNKEIKFKQTFSGHKFSKKEIEMLIAGKELEIQVKDKNNKKYTLKVILGPDAYNGYPFWGARPTQFYNKKEGLKRYKKAMHNIKTI